jgi:phospholipase/lecithinase/hemolysin
MMKHLFKTVVASAALAASNAALAGPFSTIYVFGDSLVDAGNTRLAVLSTGNPNAPAPPTQGYFQGRFTNGLNYVDLLQRNLNGQNTVASLAGGNNFAWGGALARNNGDFIPDLAAQVGTYFARTSGRTDPNALYIINVGGNDLFAAASNPAQLATFQADTIGVITAQIRALNQAGAKNILVTGLPNVGGSPGVANQGPLVAGAARAISVQFNNLFNTALDGLTLETGTTLYRFDYINFFDRIAANFAAFGLPSDIDLLTPCTTAQPNNPTPNCSRYAFFDSVHPEARFQQLAFLQIATLTGIPEPMSWALLGFGLVGLGMARRRKTVA